MHHVHVLAWAAQGSHRTGSAVAESHSQQIPNCHDFALLAMFLAFFFPLFAPSSHDTQSHSARKQQKHFITDTPLVLITTRRGGYLKLLGQASPTMNSKVCPQLIFRPICWKVVLQRTHNWIIPTILNILRNWLDSCSGKLIKGMNLTMYD
jgi:hypothetical protein